MTDASNPNDVEKLRPHKVDEKSLPSHFPTQRHRPEFWEALGRAVATFGFLEDVLGRAIFAVTGTQELPSDAAATQAAYEAWLPKLEHALSDPLGNLIVTFGKAVREHPQATITNLDALLGEFRRAAEMRNVICHGFWQVPDSAGRSVPRFVNRKLEVFETPVDIAFLNQVRSATVEMACGVMNTVTTMGYQFPGSSGLGRSVWLS
jgi:hypothetical protein